MKKMAASLPFVAYAQTFLTAHLQSPRLQTWIILIFLFLQSFSF